MTFGTGPWKEGRAGAASLCYLAPLPHQLDMLAAHHAAVGIRATLACRAADNALAPFAQRNWDLAVLDDHPAPDLAHALARLDQRAEHGLVTLTASASPADATALYRIQPAAAPATIARPGAAPMRQLPSLPAPPDAPRLRAAIADVVALAQWAIWRIDADTLDQLGTAGHADLLRWLGDQHAHIWCAPVRDISLWRPAPSA